MHPTRRRKCRRSSKADDALLQQAFDYLAAVKQVFGAQPHVHQEFTTLLKDFKEESVEAEYVIGRVRKLFQGHPDLIYGFRVFLPQPVEGSEGDAAVRLLEAPCYDGEPEVVTYPSPIGAGCPVSICARCPGLLGMDPLGLCPYPAPGPGPWAVTAALPTPSAAELVAQPLYNTFVSVRLLRRLHIAAEPLTRSAPPPGYAAQVPLASLATRFLDRGLLPRVPKRPRRLPADPEIAPALAAVQLEDLMDRCPSLSPTTAELAPGPPAEHAPPPGPPAPRLPPRLQYVARRLARAQRPGHHGAVAQRLGEAYRRPTEADAERLLEAMQRAAPPPVRRGPRASKFARALRILQAYTRAALPACRAYLRLRRLFAAAPAVVAGLRPFFPGVAPAIGGGPRQGARDPRGEAKAEPKLDPKLEVSLEVRPHVAVIPSDREEPAAQRAPPPAHEPRRREKSPRAAKPAAAPPAPRHSPGPKPPPRPARDEAAPPDPSEVCDIFGNPYLGEDVDIPPPFGPSYFKNNRPRRMYCKAQTDGYDDLGRANLNILFECAAPSAENQDRGEGYTKESREELLQYQAWDRLFSLDVAINQCEGTITFLSQLLGNPSAVGRGPPTEDQPGSSARRPFWRDIHKVTLRRVFGSAQVVKEILEEIAERPESAVPKVIVKLQMRKKEHLMDRTQLAARLHSPGGL